MKYLRYVALVLLAVVLCGTFVACSDEEAPQGMQNMAAPGEDFILYVSMEWTPNGRSGVSGAYFTVTDESEQGKDLARHSNFWTISAQRVVDESVGIEAYWNKLSAYYAASYDDFEIVPYKKATDEKPEEVYRKITIGKEGRGAGTYEAWVYEFTATVTEFAPNQELTEQKSMEFTRKYCQVISYAEDRGCFYVLTYTAREENYDKFLTEFIDVILDETVVGEFIILKEQAEVEAPKLFKDPDTSDNMIPASTNEMYYRFYVPTGWRVGNTTEYPTAFAPNGSANVSVMVYTPSNVEISVDTYWEGYCLPEYREVFDSFTLHETVTESTVGIDKDVKNAKTYTFDASIGGQDYRYAQTVIVHSSLVYVITYTALAVDGSFDQHIDDYNAMLESFTFR